MAGVSAGIMTAVLVYSPNKLMSDDRVYANKALNAESLAMVNLAGGATGPLGVRYPLLELWSHHLCWAYMLVIQLLLCCMHCLAHVWAAPHASCHCNDVTTVHISAAVADVRCVVQPLNATLLGYSKAYQVDLRNVVNTNIQAFTQLQAAQAQG